MNHLTLEKVKKQAEWFLSAVKAFEDETVGNPRYAWIRSKKKRRDREASVHGFDQRIGRPKET